MGAVSPDHAKLQMTAKDMERYEGMDKWRRHVRHFFPMALRA